MFIVMPFLLFIFFYRKKKWFFSDPDPEVDPEPLLQKRILGLNRIQIKMKRIHKTSYYLSIY